MTKKPSDPKVSDSSGTTAPSSWVEGPSKVIAAGGLRLADLLETSADMAELLDRLVALHRSARLVIGGNLADRMLDRQVLMRLRDSVTRQADEARKLQRRLPEAWEKEALREELTELIEFLDDALARIERQLGATH